MSYMKWQKEDPRGIEAKLSKFAKDRARLIPSTWWA
jgi:hypothetical protein